MLKTTNEQPKGNSKQQAIRAKIYARYGVELDADGRPKDMEKARAALMAIPSAAEDNI